jgi:hypothetical protein
MRTKETLKQHKTKTVHAHLHPPQNHFRTLEAHILFLLNACFPAIQSASNRSVLHPQQNPLQDHSLPAEKLNLRCPTTERTGHGTILHA